MRRRHSGFTSLALLVAALGGRFCCIETAPSAPASMFTDAFILCGLAIAAELLSLLASTIGERVDWVHPVFRGSDCGARVGRAS